MNFIFFEEDTGRIVAYGENPNADDIEASRIDPSWGVILGEVADPDTQIVQDGVIVDKPPRTDAELNLEVLAEVRRFRNSVLAGSDWTMLKDVQLAEEKVLEWTAYRQQLRDLPGVNGNATSFDEVVWPTPPA